MKKKILLLGSLVVLTILLVSGCTSTTKNQNGTNTNPNYQTAQHLGDELLIPLANITTTASFFSYDDSGVTIRYFAVNDAAGTPHVAFDACDVCYEAKKGYKQVGDVMQCLNCGRQFAVPSIGTENTAGGCWPSYLPMAVNGSSIVIKIADLKDKSFMF